MPAQGHVQIAEVSALQIRFVNIREGAFVASENAQQSIIEVHG